MALTMLSVVLLVSFPMGVRAEIAQVPGTESSASNISAPPGITRPPQLLGPNDVGVSEVQRQLRLCLPARGRAGRSALFGDPYL